MRASMRPRRSAGLSLRMIWAGMDQAQSRGWLVALQYRAVQAGVPAGRQGGMVSTSQGTKQLHLLLRLAGQQLGQLGRQWARRGEWRSRLLTPASRLAGLPMAQLLKQWGRLEGQHSRQLTLASRRQRGRVGLPMTQLRGRERWLGEWHSRLPILASRPPGLPMTLLGRQERWPVRLPSRHGTQPSRQQGQPIRAPGRQGSGVQQWQHLLGQC
jgi:hypothetical protein